MVPRSNPTVEATCVKVLRKREGKGYSRGRTPGTRERKGLPQRPPFWYVMVYQGWSPPPPIMGLVLMPTGLIQLE